MAKTGAGALDRDTAVHILVDKGYQYIDELPGFCAFTGDPAVDGPLNDLEGRPHVFLLACLMHRRIKAETAWGIPRQIELRTGSLEFAHLRSLPIEEVMHVMLEPEPLHCFAADMAEAIWFALDRIDEVYGGDASRMWSGRPSSAAIVRRGLAFRGAGIKIASMIANILVRDFKIPVSDRYSIDLSPDVHTRRVLPRLGLIESNQDMTGDKGLNVLVYTARELHPEYPGVFDLPVWEIGKRWCHPKNPDCAHCYMSGVCPEASDAH